MSDGDLAERAVEIGQRHIRGAFNDGLRVASELCKTVGDQLRRAPDKHGEAAMCDLLRQAILNLQQPA